MLIYFSRIRSIFFRRPTGSPARILPLHGPNKALAIIATLHDSGSNTQGPNWGQERQVSN